MTAHLQAPDLLPMLARGRHRRPSRGACFMELASYLAGERWSDHPSCTHPLLASMARSVNDLTSDAGRPRLSLLIPSVIGLAGDDLRIDAAVALRAARTALPVCAAERQRVMAVAVLTADRVLADLEGRTQDMLDAVSRAALDAAPDAERWARHFSREIGVSLGGFRRHSAPSTVRVAARAVADACVPDPDRLLHDMLAGAVADVTGLLGRGPAAPVDPHVWDGVCRVAAPA